MTRGVGSRVAAGLIAAIVLLTACNAAPSPLPTRGFQVDLLGFGARLKAAGYACQEAARLLHGFRSAGCDRTTEAGEHLFVFVYGRTDGSLAGFDLVENLMKDGTGPAILTALAPLLDGVVDTQTSSDVVAAIGLHPTPGAAATVAHGKLQVRVLQFGGLAEAMNLLAPDMVAVWGLPPEPPSPP